MRNSPITRSSVILMTTLLLATSIAVAAPSGKPLSDDWVAGRVEGALTYNRYLDSSDLSVDVNNSKAILSGTVSSNTERELARQLASNVEGVSSVDNRIKVDPDVTVRARSSSYQRASDATTTAAVSSRLETSRELHTSKLDVATTNGVVTLRGNVGSPELKERAERIAYNTTDVREVKNELKVVDGATLGKTLNQVSDSVAQTVSDSWITSKVRTALLFSSDFPGSSVDVTTESGTVKLEGYARNAEQRTEIEKMVSDFVGVRKVENHLDLRTKG